MEDNYANKGMPAHLRRKRARQAAGLTLEDAAAEMGVSRCTVHAWEADRKRKYASRPYPKKRKKICETYGKKYDELFD